MFGGEQREQCKSRSSVTGKHVEQRKLLRTKHVETNIDVTGLTGAKER